MWFSSVSFSIRCSLVFVHYLLVVFVQFIIWLLECSVVFRKIGLMQFHSHTYDSRTFSVTVLCVFIVTFKIKSVCSIMQQSVFFLNNFPTIFHTTRKNVSKLSVAKMCNVLLQNAIFFFIFKFSH